MQDNYAGIHVQDLHTAGELHEWLLPVGVAGQVRSWRLASPLEFPMTQMTHPPILRQPGEGKSVAVVGDNYRFLATGDDTDGRYAMFEACVSPGGGPPPHIHSREEESFYVLEGEITFQVGDDRIVAKAGMFANMPIGSLHSFRNNTDRLARMIISVAPAGLEKMFLEVGQPVTWGQQALPPSKAEIDRLLAVAPSYGIEIRLPQH